MLREQIEKREGGLEVYALVLMVGNGRELLCSLRRRLVRAFLSLSCRPDTFSSLHLLPTR